MVAWVWGWRLWSQLDNFIRDQLKDCSLQSIALPISLQDKLTAIRDSYLLDYCSLANYISDDCTFDARQGNFPF